MDALLDRFYEEIDHEIKYQFKEYYVKVSQLNNSFFVLIKWRGKILGRKRDFYLIVWKE